MPAIFFLIGYAVAYFVTVWMVGKNFVKLNCKVCNNGILITECSDVECEVCGAIYNVREIKKDKMAIKLVLNKGQVMQKCRCSSGFLIEPNFNGSKVCPNCGIKYHVRNPQGGIYRIRRLEDIVTFQRTRRIHGNRLISDGDLHKLNMEAD